MHHLSALDALFLQLETAEVPAHVGSVSLLKKPGGHRGSFYPRIRKHIESRLHLAPLFSRRLAFMPLDLANPIWLSGAKIDSQSHPHQRATADRSGIRDRTGRPGHIQAGRCLHA